MGNRFILLSALNGFIAVAFGAFATHALKADFSEQQMSWVQTGWNYQVFHTLALLALGFFWSATQETAPKCRKTAVNIIGIFWTIGIIGFSGTLYTMALLNTKSIVMLVPMGGVAFLVGWLVLLFVAIRSNIKK